MRLNLIFKRIFDIIISFLLLVMLLPLLFFIIVLLGITNKGKVFFIQIRTGKNGRIFKLFKYKTMSDDIDINGRLLPDNLRITQIGGYIRKFSLDELPQLINVLKGDMSIIGPRPLLCEYLPLYNNRQARRHEVNPGITGWAQVNGRNNISWKDKLEFDVWYVDNMSFCLDLKILFLTLKKVIKREGINASQNITMEPFNGNN